MKRASLDVGAKSRARGSTVASRGNGSARKPSRKTHIKIPSVEGELGYPQDLIDKYKSSKRRSRPVSAASPAQRRKVAAMDCVVCGRGRTASMPLDPAHLWPVGRGGCSDPDCVVALCRVHHRAFDDGVLSILEHLEPDHRREIAHAVEHGGLLSALQRLTGERFVPAKEAA